MFVSELVGKQRIFALGGEGEEPKHLRTWLSSAAGRTGGVLSLLTGHAVAAAFARQTLDTVGGGLDLLFSALHASSGPAPAAVCAVSPLPAPLPRDPRIILDT